MTNTTNNTTKTANVDFFKASKELSSRTSEFFRVIIKKAELNTIYSAKIAANEASIASIDDMIKNGTSIDVPEEDLEKLKRREYFSLPGKCGCDV